MSDLLQYYRECGAWVVTTQEVRCCQKLYGGQDTMIAEMAKQDVFFYIHDATLPVDVTPITYLDRIAMFAPSGLKRGRPVALIAAPITPDTRLLRELLEAQDVTAVFMPKDHGLSMARAGLSEFHGNMVELSDKLITAMTGVQFDMPDLSAINAQDEDYFTPRNRRERRQGKQLDSKHKGRSEWWNR